MQSSNTAIADSRDVYWTDSRAHHRHRHTHTHTQNNAGTASECGDATTLHEQLDVS